MEGTFKTIEKQSEVLHKDRGSKFIGLACPVENDEELKNTLNQLRAQYADATHVCYAYRMGLTGENYRANDDGEPSNSAGQPILREIKSKDLTHILVAVVRYYGGKKLGVSGLIDAYGSAAKQAIEACTIVSKTIQKTCWLKHLGAKDFQVYELANRLNFTIIQPPNIPGGFFEIKLSKSKYDEFNDHLESLPNFELTDKPNGL